MSGYTEAEQAGIPAFGLLHPDDAAAAAETLRALLAAPGARAQGECRARRKDGASYWVEYVAVNLLDEPAVRAIVVNYRDVTERVA